MKNKEIIYRVKNTIKEQNKDSLVTNKYVYNVLRTAAIFLIKREADSKNTIYFQSNLWSTLCVDMIKVPVSECINIPVDCELWRSKEKLPKFVETTNGFLYKSISSIDNYTNFFLTTPYIQQLKSKLRYNKNKYVWIENEYIYSTCAFPVIKIVGLFEKSLGGDSCSRMEDIFFCPEYLTDSVIKLSLQELLQSKQIPYDNNENKNTSN